MTTFELWNNTLFQIHTTGPEDDIVDDQEALEAQNNSSNVTNHPFNVIWMGKALNDTTFYSKIRYLCITELPSNVKSIKTVTLKHPK